MMKKVCETCGNVIPDSSRSGMCPICALTSARSEEREEMVSEGDIIAEKYEILQELGEGGFGMVYRAHQLKPFEREVALKVLKAERLQEGAIERFVLEKQAMAMLTHTSIAKIFDAGETEEGLPYFVMELVDGVPVTDYCDGKRLSLSERLRLFGEICRVVQYAHQKGVIHCDLKPSNIFVSDEGGQAQIKIIDFGVARAKGGSLLGLVDLDDSGMVIGTPAYMAPEQAAGMEDIDTRTDIYSLGVLLYELLTGTPPFSMREFKEAGLKAILRMVQEDVPLVPSQRLKEEEEKGMREIAELRNVALDQLRKSVRGDLDWIVMKALEKDRDWRYPAASSMVVDIDSYLGHHPLPSRKKTLFYYGYKFLNRNRKSVWLVGLCLLILLGITLFLRYDKRQDQQRHADLLGETLFKCRVERLPDVVSRIGPYLSFLEEELQEQSNSQEISNSERMRAGLVLRSNHSVGIEMIEPWLFEAPVDELGIVLGMLEGNLGDLETRAWKVMEDDRGGIETRIRAAVICAQSGEGDPRWGRFGNQVARWVIDSGGEARQWAVLLKPVAKFLVPAMVEMIGEARAHQFVSLSTALGGMVETAEPVLVKAMDEAVNQRGAGNGVNELTNARLGARLALVLLSLGKPLHVWGYLEHHRYPDLRSYLIHGMAAYEIDESLILKRLRTEHSPGVIAALLLALGDYEYTQIEEINRRELQPILENFYSRNQDSGVRSAAEWLLRHWGLDQNLDALDQRLRTGEVVGDRRWFITRGGNFTMAILPAPAEFMMGSPAHERGRPVSSERDHEKLHLEKIDRKIAVATKEVTINLFMEFAKEMGISRKKRKNVLPGENPWNGLIGEDYLPTSAISHVTLKEAMVFCWWLTRRENIVDEEQCYDFPVGGKFDEVNPTTRSGHLTRGGYRLPTEAEWEYACRGGAVTARYYGEDEDMLNKYAWFRGVTKNFPRPPGLLRPNGYGLFDTLGNVAEWCQEPYRKEYQSDPMGLSFTVDEKTSKSIHDEGSWHVLRGGSYLQSPKYLRAAWRNATPHCNLPFSSFRIVRTIKK